MSDTPLKLRAKDEEDVQVVSAILQDAIAPLSDMTYNPDAKNFIMVVHRLRREAKQQGLERVCCAVNVQGVVQTQSQGIDQTHQARILDLLAVIPEKQSLTFIFAGNAQIRLQLQNWSMIIEDFGAPWPAQCAPCHDQAENTNKA